MPCKVFLRHDQTGSEREASRTPHVIVYAPSWVREGLEILAKYVKDVEFQVHTKPSLKRSRNASAPAPKLLETFKISGNINDETDSLVLLQKIARNEAKNTNGVINLSNYSPDIKDSKIIYSIKDLARQSVIVGKDSTTFCGGYKSSRVEQKGEPVFICDLAALQFQKPYNSGRLILVQESDPYKGPLDDFIFEKVVGEKKKSFQEIAAKSDDAEIKKRYLKHDGYGKLGGKGSCFMDTVAYRKFVQLDVVLSGLALAEVASKEGCKLNFKFLKYGTGYFAWKFVKELDALILPGVIDGLEALLAREDSEVLVQETIKCLEFPFYKSDPESSRRLDQLKKKYKLEYRFSKEDALKQTMKGKGLITATTNCADSNVACGNAMGFKSVDGAIAENLLSKGNIFCPNMNHQMESKYIDV